MESNITYLLYIVKTYLIQGPSSFKENWNFLVGTILLPIKPLTIYLYRIVGHFGKKHGLSRIEESLTLYSNVNLRKIYNKERNNKTCI